MIMATNPSMFILMIILLSSSAVHISAAAPLRPNAALLRRACATTAYPDFCLNYLSKTPSVASASRRSRPTLATAIVDTGLTYAKLMREYASNKAAAPETRAAAGSKPAAAYAECARALGDTATQLEMAVQMIEQLATAVTAGDDASYSLMRAGDGVAACKQKLAAAKVEDRYMKISSKHVEVYSVAADNILTDLKRNGKKGN